MRFLCISCDFKGGAFLSTLAELGHEVYLITGEHTRHESWPEQSLSDVFYMPGSDGRLWNLDDLVSGTAHLMRNARIDRIVAMDDYDVRKAAALREEFRLPGMGQTTARHFYDKLAMRIQARDAGIRVPGFCALFNDADINLFLEDSHGPWFIKPRSDAGALGIRRIESKEDFWQKSGELGEQRHRYLLEEFVGGNVCHVDSISHHDEILFTRCSQYRKPPFDVAHGGGIFQSATVEHDSKLDKALQTVNAEVLAAFGMRHGASHSEYIVHDGEPYFLETSARVGGAHLAEMVEAATGVNLWSEWAKLEHALLTGSDYTKPASDQLHAGIIASLSRVEQPDYAQYQHPEIWWTMPKRHHVGFIFQHAELARIHEMLDTYQQVIATAYHASVPLAE